MKHFFRFVSEEKTDDEKNMYTQKRKFDVNEINAHSWDKIRSAHRRDAYYLRNLVDLDENSLQLTESQIEEIKTFWKPYEWAYKNDLNIQKVFFQQSGKFDPSYIGFGLQRHSLVRFWNHPTYATYRNKYYLPKLFPLVKHPRTYIANNYGMYLEQDCNLISKDTAIKKILEILESETELIIKPSDDSGSGMGITFAEKGMTYQEIEKAFASFKDNFVCQKVIKNHPSYAAPHKDSLNTLRIATLIYHNEVMLVGTVFRMGVAGKLDNWGQGGLVCPVYEGKCGDFAVTENGHKVYVHPSGFEFAGHELYRCLEAEELAKKMHAVIPQQKYVSWDLTVDDAGDIVMVEMNTPGSSELLQAVGINAYINKEIAKEIFDEYLIKRFFVNKAIFEWNYREFSDHISLTEYAGIKDVEEITVPEQIEEKRIAMIYEDAFKNCTSLKVINIPEKIAFKGAILKSQNPKCVINYFTNKGE